MFRFALASTALVVSALTALAQAPLTMTVYKSPTCGCCAKWVEHVKKAGFAVTVKDMPNVGEIKFARGVPAELASCHTAVVGDYVVEGHVPAPDVRRLLKERPKVRGIAVGGMPAGSPGMEVPGGRADKYEVVAFLRDGTTRTFARH